MIYKILRLLDKIKPIENVSAHCDIPCKIYDPIISQLAVLSMIRLVDLIEEIEKKDDGWCIFWLFDEKSPQSPDSDGHGQGGADPQGRVHQAVGEFHLHEALFEGSGGKNSQRGGLPPPIRRVSQAV